MGRLYLRQRVLSDSEEQPVWDDTRQVCYHLRGRLFNAGSKISLQNRAREECFYVEEAFCSFLATFTILRAGEEYAQVKQKFSLFRPQLTIRSTVHRWEIDGNIWGMSVQLVRDGRPVATLTKGWEDWCKAYYTLEVPQPSDEPEALALLIAIDRFIHGGGG